MSIQVPQTTEAAVSSIVASTVRSGYAVDTAPVATFGGNAIPADGLYRINAYLVSLPDATNGNIQAQISFTDDFSVQSGVGIGSGTGLPNSISTAVRLKAGSTINTQVVIPEDSPTGTPHWSLSLSIEQL